MIPYSVLIGLVFLLAVACAVSLYVLDRVRRREALFRWASEHRYRIVKFTQPMVENTPFRFTLSKSQHVFKVTVTDPVGRERNGFVRLGGFWRGLASDQAEIRWQP
jgi:hypothetical protein